MAYNVIAQVDLHYPWQNGEDVERGDGVDAGIDVFEIIVVSQCIKIPQRIDIIWVDVQNFQASRDKGIVEPQ